MRKHKKLAIGAGIVLILILLLHFVPVKKNLGYLVLSDPNNPNQISAETCIGHTGPVPQYFRLITGGYNGYNSEKKTFVKDSRAAFGDSIDYGCADPVELRLYIL